MAENDYRRALIMLRTVEPGYSGHVRLEKRTLMGNFCFVVHAPASSRLLYAALVGRRGENYFAAPLGTLARDGRGQAALRVDFDPRNIGGRELDSYPLTVVLLVTPEGECSIVLVGNVNGSEEMDWTKVREAACSLFAAQIPSPQPRQESDSETPSAPEAETEAAPEGPSDTEQPEAVATFSGLRPTAAKEPAAVKSAPVAEAAPATEAPSAPETPAASETPAVTETPPATEAPPTPAAEDRSQEAQEDTRVAELRAILEQQLQSPSASEEERADAQGLRDALDAGEVEEFPQLDGYLFVRIPTPEGCGYPCAFVGAQVEDGELRSLCYALPGTFAAEPPAGLTSYVFLGGRSAGWWAYCVDFGGE